MEKLLFCCLLCICSMSLGRMSPLLYQQLFKTVEDLSITAKMDTQGLHSPGRPNGDCLLSVFQCFVNQSSLLEPADPKNKQHFNVLLSRLKYSLHRINLTNKNTSCSPCNHYKLQPSRIFLKDFRSLLQWLNRL